MSETTTEQLVEIEGQACIVTPDDVAAQQLVRGLVLQVAAAIEPEAEPQAETCGFEGKILCEVPQAADTPATELPPPDGWRVLAVGERLRDGDMTVRKDGYCYPTERVGGSVGSNQRYIRLIESEPQPEAIQVREGRWRTRGGDIKNIRPCEPLIGAYYVWPWTDGFMTFQDNGRHQGSKESPNDLVEYLGPIEKQPEPQPEPVPQAESDAELRIRLLQQANDSQAETIGRLLTEARDLNMEIGGLERRLSERDARIRDLETIYSAATKSFEDANKANDALRAQVRILQQEANKKTSRIEFLETLNAGNGAAIDDYRAHVEKLQGLLDTARGQLETAAREHDSLSTQLAAVKAELASVAADRQRLQIELDAAQQVPVDSPELRQLRADLAEVAHDRDTYKHAHELLVQDIDATHQRTKVMTVEAIVEWLVPIRTCGSQALAAAVVSNLPHIMRSLTGLVDEEPDPQLAPY